MQQHRHIVTIDVIINMMPPRTAIATGIPNLAIYGLAVGVIVPAVRVPPELNV